MSGGEVTLYPAWKEFKRQLIASGLTYGSVITRAQIFAGLGIDEPRTIPEYESARREVLNQFTLLRDALLDEHCMMLVASRDGAYRVCDPKDQTRIAMDQRTRKVVNVMRRMMREVTFVEVSMLDDAERKENADAQARAAALLHMTRTRIGHAEL